MELKQYGLTPDDQWASLVWVEIFRDEDMQSNRRIPIGYVLVIDHKFGDRAQYKMPGGHKNNIIPGTDRRRVDRTPLDTGISELTEETGIAVKAQQIRYVGKYPGRRGDHFKCLFVASISESERDWMNNHQAGNEGEQPKFFTVAEFYQCARSGKVMREHYDRLVEFAVILPLGRGA